MITVHVEGNVPHVVVEELLQNVKPLRRVDEPIIPLGERRVVEVHVLQVCNGIPGLKHLLKEPLFY
jgi:hypothetical protein